MAQSPGLYASVLLACMHACMAVAVSASVIVAVQRGSRACRYSSPARGGRDARASSRLLHLIEAHFCTISTVIAQHDLARISDTLARLHAR
jgi:hypothetical protein